jgi:hypothetical protein
MGIVEDIYKESKEKRKRNGRGSPFILFVTF